MGFGLLVISGIFTVIGMILNNRLRSKFHKYAQIPLSNRMNGADVARTMLKYYGINDVQVMHVPGQLTDFYNPANKTVNLSDEVFESSSVAAAAVAAHECGHAVQHATAYSFLQLRSAIVPVVNLAAGVQQFVFMFGLAGAYLFHNIWIMMIVLVVFAITTLFSLITLPVEFDASRRALAWLDASGFARGEEYAGAKDALTWAALTYVAAALAALVQLLYILSMFLGRRN